MARKMGGRHGGPRPGAGRKPDIAKQIQKQASLAARLNMGVQASLAELADNAPSLMRAAISAAVDGNLGMQKFLLDLLTRTGRVGEEEKTPIEELAQKWQEKGGELHLHQHLNETHVEVPSVTTSAI